MNQEPPKNLTPLTHRELKDKILSKVGGDLADIEQALRENLNPHLDLVSEIAGHLLFSGGKRLRPLLMLLSSRLCSHQINPIDPIAQNLNYKTIVQFSTIFEYLHAATLLHDDVVDEAQMRRGKAAAHSIWSVPKVVLTGDFLLARSLSLAAKTEIPQIISIMAGITEDMSQGEIDQMEQKGRLDLTESQYLRIIKRKTAVLIQGACKSGAILAHSGRINYKNSHKNSDSVNQNGYNDHVINHTTRNESQLREFHINSTNNTITITKDEAFKREEALDNYGYHLGVAFQMADDLLDYTGDSVSLGKNRGADIREGKLTLPLIYALSKAEGNDRAVMEDIIKGSVSCDKREDNLSSSNTDEHLNSSVNSFDLILEKIKRYKGIEYTELQAENHVEQAKKSLGIFQACEAKELLLMLADYSIARKI